MNIYTKTGDGGETSLFDNKRVLKDSIRVESYGTVDELISFLGLSKNYVKNDEIYNVLSNIQNKLFTVGAMLATEDNSKLPYKISEEDIEYLEVKIDFYMDKVNVPTEFVVPGSGKASSYLHVSRTICRRAERRIITLSRSEEIDLKVIKYVNRLSDLLYAIGRYVEEREEKVEFKS